MSPTDLVTQPVTTPAPDKVSSVPSLEDVVAAIVTASVAAGVACSNSDAEHVVDMFARTYSVITASGRRGGTYALPQAFLDSHAYRVMEATIVDDTPARYGDGSVLDLVNRHLLPTTDPTVIAGFRHSALISGVRDYCTICLVVETVEV